MTELETYKRALQKISEYGIKPTGETELQRIKRLKSIADKALFIAVVVGQSEQLVCPVCSRTDCVKMVGINAMTVKNLQNRRQTNCLQRIECIKCELRRNF